MNNKQRYREFCKIEPSIPIFSKDWWLDAVCGEDHWDVALIEKGGEIVAALPYYVKSKMGLKLITMPILTQTLGIWMRSSQAKYAKQLAQQKDLMNGLIEQLPKYDSFSQNFHYTITNWLPFYWHGFKQTTRYTYVIDNLTDLDLIWKGTQANIKREIKKARNRFNIQVKTDLDIEQFLLINELTFKRQGMKQPYSTNMVKRLETTCQAHNARRIFFAQDEKGQLHAVAYIVWDKNSAYYLMGGGDPKLRNSGATSLLMWEAIRFAATVTQKFDFEGSMIEPVERFFRNFGARQVPYFQISHMSKRMAVLSHGRHFMRSLFLGK